MLRKRWVAVAALAAAGYAAPAASAETVYGLTDSNDLVVFDSATPGTTSPVLDVTLPAGVTEIEGIDVRPATLQVYALGQNGQLFKIDTVTGVSTTVGSPLTLTGSDFDIDFNPTVDRLRIVSDGEQNLRVNPNNGVLAATDGPLAPAGNVTGAAYTNSAPANSAADGADADLLPDAPTTTLFDIDTASDQLLTQSPPNAGTLTDGKALGVDLVGDVGFDISTASTPGTGTPGANTAYLAGRTADAQDRLYTVNTTSGTATSVGEIGGSSKVKDITVAAPVPQVAVLYTPAAGAQQLVTYRVDRPGDAGSPVSVSGLQGGETLVGIDRRPLNSTVYGVGSTGRVYTLNLGTGAATVVPGGPFSPLPSGDAGVDFNPAPGAAIRLVTESDQNLSVDSTTSIAATQTALAFATGDPNAAANPNITAAAYNNPVTPAPASTFLYDVDTSLDALVTQGIRDAAGADLAAPAFGNGVLSTIGALGILIEDGTGFDTIARFNQQFGAFDPSGIPEPPRLYSVNASGGAGTPANGSVALIGDLAGVPAPALTTTIDGMTVVQDNILPAAPTPAATATPTPTPTSTIPSPTPTYVVPTPTPSPGPTGRKKPGLKVKVRPKNDKKSPYRFTAKGRLVLPKGVGKGKGCKGQVRLTLRRKGSGKPLSTTRKGVKRNCSFKVKTSFKAKDLKKSQRKKGKLRAIVRFQGNAVLKGKKVTKQVSYGRKK